MQLSWQITHDETTSTSMAMIGSDYMLHTLRWSLEQYIVYYLQCLWMALKVTNLSLFHVARIEDLIF